jgi:hypothetical protein
LSTAGSVEPVNPVACCRGPVNPVACCTWH